MVVHSGEKLLAMDDDGFSDPYCIVTANREKVRHIFYTNNTSDRYCIVTANREKVHHVWYTNNTSDPY